MSAQPTPIMPVAVQAGDGKVYQFPTPDLAKQFEKEAQEAGGETQRLEPALPGPARSLYCLESHLAALLDTEELLSEDLEREYELELHATLLATVEKRDRVAQFMGWLESQVSFAHAEVARLQKREAFYERALDKMKSYVSRVIESMGVDAKGKRKRLEGRTHTMWLHGCDKRAEVTDAGAVPTKYKRITLTLPVETWELMCDSLDFELSEQIRAEAKSIDIEVSSSLVKADLKASILVPGGEPTLQIPGAQLAGGTYLVRE